MNTQEHRTRGALRRHEKSICICRSNFSAEGGLITHSSINAHHQADNETDTQTPVASIKCPSFSTPRPPDAIPVRVCCSCLVHKSRPPPTQLSQIQLQSPVAHSVFEIQRKLNVKDGMLLCCRRIRSARRLR